MSKSKPPVSGYQAMRMAMRLLEVHSNLSKKEIGIIVEEEFARRFGRQALLEIGKEEVANVN